MSRLTSTDVLVVGAGIAGSALAYELSRRGVHVTLVERGAGGPAGASTVPAALINPHRGRTARAQLADVAGARAFWALVSDLEAEAGASGAHHTGVLRVADSARQAQAWQKLEAGTRWLEAAEVPAHYHAPFGALLVESGGWLKPPKLLATLVRAATGRTATVAWGTEFVGVRARAATARTADQSAGDLVVTLRAAGDAPTELGCRAVVVATGAWQPAELRLPRLELLWGEAHVYDLGFTPPLPLAGAVVAAFEDGAAVVTGGHRHVGWLGALPVGATGEPQGSGAPDMLRTLAWQLPQAAGARVTGSWHGVRAKRSSGQPVVRRLAPGVHVMIGFGGRGFLRAAWAASEMADRLAAGLR